METTTEKYEFLSSGWLAAVGRVVDRFVADHDVTGIDYAISEELTDPPMSRPLTPEGTVGWFIRVRNGMAEIGDRPLRDADLRVLADYATHHDLSVRIWAGDALAIETSRSLREQATADGRLHIEGDLSAVPPLIGELIQSLHDPVATFTR